MRVALNTRVDHCRRGMFVSSPPLSSIFDCCLPFSAHYTSIIVGIFLVSPPLASAPGSSRQSPPLSQCQCDHIYGHWRTPPLKKISMILQHNRNNAESVQKLGLVDKNIVPVEVDLPGTILLKNLLATSPLLNFISCYAVANFVLMI